MTIRTSCDCGKTFQLRDELAGTRVKCPDCGRIFEVPVPAVVVEDLPSTANIVAPRALAASIQPAATGRGPLLAVAAAFGGLALLFLLFLTISLARRMGNSTPIVATQGETSTGPSTAAVIPPPPNSTTPPPTNGWTPPIDQAIEAPQWPDQVALSIPLPSTANRIVFPATPSPIVVTGLNFSGGQNVGTWDLITGQKLAKLQAPVEKATGQFAITSDGKYLAATLSLDTKIPTVRVWNFETGQPQTDIVCDESGLQLNAIEFAGPTRLVTVTYGSANKKLVHRLRIWNVASGRQLHGLELNENFQRSHLAISPGGRYLAAYGQGNTLSFFDLEKGTPIGTIAVADALSQSPGPFQGLAFSPDGRELALVLSGSHTLVPFFDLKTGELADTLELAGRLPISSVYQGAAIEWLGDRGWCLFGTSIVDRATRRLVWNLEMPVGDRLTARRTLTGGWIAPTGGRTDRKLSFVPIPWDRIDASLAAMQSDSPARLRPGMKISLNIVPEELRFGSADETVQRLTDTFRQRLEADNVSIADDQPLVLNVRYRETEGETMHERKGVGGQPSFGRSVQATNFILSMDLTPRGETENLWSHDFKHDPKVVTLFGQKEVSDASVRESNFKSLLYSLPSESVPYFLPNDPSLSRLPGVTRP